jgi:hypothetical protein
MTPNRRSLMLGSGMAALSGLAPAVVLASAAGLPGRDEFEALLGESFELADGGRLRLLRVSDGPATERLAQFSLVLEAESAQGGGLLELRHPRTGRFALRLEPSGAAGQALLRADLCLQA